MILTLDRIKKHLNIDSDYNDDDEYLETLALVAEDSVKVHLNVGDLYGLNEAGEVPASIVHAMLLLIGNLYMNREPVTFGSVTQIPYT